MTDVGIIRMREIPTREYRTLVEEIQGFVKKATSRKYNLKDISEREVLLKEWHARAVEECLNMKYEEVICLAGLSELMYKVFD